MALKSRDGERYSRKVETKRERKQLHLDKIDLNSKDVARDRVSSSRGHDNYKVIPSYL